MKKVILSSHLIIGAATMFGLTSCNNDRSMEDTSRVSLSAIENPSDMENQCAYVDQNWSSSAILKTSLNSSTDTNFMNSQMTNISRLYGRTAPTLRFVYDENNPNSTYNAISYSTGKIYYGYAIYYEAKAKGGDIVNAMILAHEYGHQLQYIYGLPTTTESTARPNELEADGFAGYYLRKPEGYNKSSFSEIATAYEFAQSIGDYNTTSAGHHGTPAQRRSAVRLGFLLGQYDLGAKDFDYNFFYYYNGVLNGTYKMAKNSKYPKLDSYMSQYLDELKKIQNGEISGDEYKNL